jgi:hypothetical protein
MIVTTSFKISEISGGVLGRRENGEKARNKILLLVEELEKVTIDFENLTSISPSFLEEAIVKLVTHYGKDEFKQKIEFININPSIKSTMNAMLASQIRRLNDSTKE